MEDEVNGKEEEMSSSSAPPNVDTEKKREAQQLDAVTDFVDEREFDSTKAQQVSHKSTAPVAQAFHSLTAVDAATATPATSQIHSEDNNKVKVKDDDVSFLMQELEWPEDEVIGRLRQHHNDLHLVLHDAIYVPDRALSLSTSNAE